MARIQLLDRNVRCRPTLPWIIVEEHMARYLDASSSERPPPPGLHTHIRTNPRVKGLLWSAAIGMIVLIVLAMVASKMF
jgi:hypothetical protein